MLTSKKQVEIWPLRLIDLDDEEQVQVVYSLLGRLPHVIHYYLSNYIFPEVMRHQGMKLSACGQELGGGIQIFYYLPNRVFFFDSSNMLFSPTVWVSLEHQAICFLSS